MHQVHATRRMGPRRIAALVIALGIVTPLAVGSAAGAQTGAVPGVTPKTIDVGAVIAKTNPTGIRYQDVVDGAKIYFDQVNKAGGVNGRSIKIVKVLDDQTRSSKSILAARSLVEEEKVFAAFQAGSEFAGADVYKKAGTPVFGYNIQEEWSNAPNMFGTYGSYLCLKECPQWAGAFIANEEGFKRPAIFAYGSAPQSYECANASKAAFEKWGITPVVFDTSISFGFSANDISGAVQAVKDNNADFVVTCMDLNGMLSLKKTIENAGIQGVRYLAPQGYDAETLKKLSKDLDGMYFLAQFTPFEAAQGNPGMQKFLKAMKRNGRSPNENLLVGWTGAALLTEGLKRAGENPTQQGVIDAINKITDWSAGGVIRPINWTTAHEAPKPGSQACSSFVQAKNGKFVPLFGDPGKPMVCISSGPYPTSLDDYVTISPADPPQ